MPQDAFTLRHAARELDAALKGGRVNKINQPDRETLSLYLYTGKRTLKLTLSANASDCGAYFSDEDRENPLTAPNFCMLLRKHLQGAQILGVEQVKFERILAFRFACVSDFSSAERVLYAEIMGKYSNLLLTERGVILGALKTTAADAGTKRLILAGAKYVLPAPQEKTDPSDFAALSALCAHAQGELENFLFTRVAGLAPCTARMLAQCYRGGDLAKYVYDYLFSDETAPCVLERDGEAVDFYARHAEGARPFETLSAAQTYYYTKKRARREAENARRRLLAAVNGAVKKQEKRLAQIKEKQKEAERCEDVRVKGELLTANLYALGRGMKACELTDFYSETGEKVKIALDPALTPAQNAQAYFKKYRKQKRTLEALAPQERETLEELAYLKSLLPVLTAAENKEDLAAAEEELFAAGLLKAPQERTKKKRPPIPYRTFEKDGFTIYAGRSNMQNDRLIRESAPDDLWLHARNVHSCHAVIKTAGRAVPEEVLAFAAGVCAKYSAGGGEKLPVDACPVRRVKKPPKSRPGFVTYSDFQTVSGDPALVSETNA